MTESPAPITGGPSNPSTELPLEAYATILARILHRGGAPPTAVLAELGVSSEAFARAHERFIQELGRSLERRKGILAMTFASTFARTSRLCPPLDLPGLEGAEERRAALAVPSFLKGEPEKDASPSTVALAVTPQTFLAVGPTSKALPFQAAPPPPIEVTTPKRASQRPQAPEPAPPRPAATGTVLADVGATAFLAEATLPLTIQSYAALSVELTMRPPDKLAVLARYGLKSLEQHRATDETMRTALEQNAGLRGRFQALVMHYSTTMRKP
ncbi:MAG: hypothetical protein U0414_00930 [Polyangiaceae bacterium]